MGKTKPLGRLSFYLLSVLGALVGAANGILCAFFICWVIWLIYVTDAPKSGCTAYNYTHSTGRKAHKNRSHKARQSQIENISALKPELRKLPVWANTEVPGFPAAYLALVIP